MTSEPQDERGVGNGEAIRFLDAIKAANPKHLVPEKTVSLVNTFVLLSCFSAFSKQQQPQQRTALLTEKPLDNPVVPWSISFALVQAAVVRPLSVTYKYQIAAHVLPSEYTVSSPDDWQFAQCSPQILHVNVSEQMRTEVVPRLASLTPWVRWLGINQVDKCLDVELALAHSGMSNVRLSVATWKIKQEERHTSTAADARATQFSPCSEYRLNRDTLAHLALHVTSGGSENRQLRSILQFAASLHSKSLRSIDFLAVSIADPVTPLQYIASTEDLPNLTSLSVTIPALSAVSSTLLSTIPEPLVMQRLETLILCGEHAKTPMGRDGLRTLFHSAGFAAKLTHLYLHSCAINSVDAATIKIGLDSSANVLPSLVHLSLRLNRIDGDGLRHIMESKRIRGTSDKGFTQLQVLDLRSNPIPDNFVLEAVTLFEAFPPSGIQMLRFHPSGNPATMNMLRAVNFARSGVDTM